MTNLFENNKFQSVQERIDDVNKLIKVIPEKRKSPNSCDECQVGESGSDVADLKKNNEESKGDVTELRKSITVKIDNYVHDAFHTLTPHFNYYLYDQYNIE